MSLLSPLSGGAVQGDHHYKTSEVDRSHGPRVYISATASDLREMARHLDMEVQWYSGHYGLTVVQVKLSREKAQQLWIAADEPDQLARECRRQVRRDK